MMSAAQRSFQFHSGSIQLLGHSLSSLLKNRFNSTLVRFNTHLRHSATYRKKSFNSTLVRFNRVPSPVHPGGRELVSIPLWFDSTLYLKAYLCPAKVVSIPLWFDSTNEGEEAVASFERFNSTLVRFNAIRFARQSMLQHVSIPLWFDSTNSEMPSIRFDASFQFHSGSIQLEKDTTQGLRLKEFQFHSGSIQLIKDFVQLFGIIVSIPLWFDSTGNLHHKRILLNRVSIPLWFDST